MSRLNRVLLKAATFAIADKINGKVIGFGSDKNHFINKVVSLALARIALDRLIFSRQRDSVETRVINEDLETEDFPYYIKATFPGGYDYKMGSMYSINVEEAVKEYTIKWSNIMDEIIKEKFVDIKDKERKIRLYPLTDKEKANMVRKVKQAEAEIIEIQEWIEEIEKDGPEIYLK
jgi:hypothetical protein